MGQDRQPFERSPETDAAIGRATALLDPVPKGTTVPFAEVERAAGFSRFDNRWQAFWSRLRRDFRRRGVVLDAWKWGGVRVLTNEEALTVLPKRRQRKALSQYTRTVRETTCIPDRELTTSQREQKYRRLELARMGRRQALAKLRLSSALDRPRGAVMPKPKMV